MDNTKYDETSNEIIPKVKLEFANLGMYQESNTNREIWENLIEDCEDLDFLVRNKIAIDFSNTQNTVVMCY